MSRKKLEYVIVRTQSAGVFAGYLESRDGKEGTLRNARRLWYWSGAASLSQLAVDGVSKPKACKFPVEVDRVELTEIIEVLSVTEKARLSIAEVTVWQDGSGYGYGYGDGTGSGSGSGSGSGYG